MMVNVNHTESWLFVCWIGLSSSETTSPANTSSPPSHFTLSSSNGPDTSTTAARPIAF